ncbi:tRNA-dihydrouridine synthase, partial [Escherichia coli]|uniref:tRNA-dihydrouridine synthase n=1 Tax=Escherichia coli TaxID=562 RepID=UPI0020245E33
TPSGTLVRVQLSGQFPQWLAENAARAVDLGSWGVDLNCGCPSKTVPGRGCGAAFPNSSYTLPPGCTLIAEHGTARFSTRVDPRLRSGVGGGEVGRGGGGG